MSTKDTLFKDLSELQKLYAGLSEFLAKSDTRMLQALEKGLSVYSADKLTKEELAEKAKLEKIVEAFGADSDMGKFAQKQIGKLTGDKTDKAWAAYRQHMSPTKASTSSKGDMPDTGVWRCPFRDDTIFIELRKHAGIVVKLNADKAVRQEIPEYLQGYAKSLTSPSAIRRFAYAFHNKAVPSDCKDGLGTREKGLIGGSLAHMVSDDPDAWEKNPANMPFLPSDDKSDDKSK